MPCDEDELFGIWEGNHVLERILDLGGDETSPQVGPTDLGAKPFEGLLDNLMRLGIFSRQRESRVQMPDVYRVAFGIGRKGGIPPIRLAAI